MTTLLKYVEEQMQPTQPNYPRFRPGDNITVNYKIVEGDKTRSQAFRGDVIQIRGCGNSRMFTVRKMSNGVGVERVLPFYSPFIESIELHKRGRVRRARLFYLRALVGKKARIKELQTARPAAKVKA